MNEYELDTKVIHAGEPNPRIGGAVCVPVFQSAMFEYQGETDYHALKYIRLNNTPNHRALGEKLAALEGSEAAVVTSSGMAAISTTLLALLKAGDHLLVQNTLYGGTHDLVFKDLADYGISCDVLDEDPARWAAQCRNNTRVVYTEAMTNPTLRVIDHGAVTRLAADHGLIAVIDATFATPINFRPLSVGYHLAVHSATKYLNGHSDLVAGVVAGSSELVSRVTHKLNHLGGSLDPHACFLFHRGLKTLAVRVRQQNETTQAIAEFLEKHPGVVRVNYPGLPEHPDYHLAQRYFTGCCGVLSFELAEHLDAAELMSHARLPIITFSLGGVETLMIQPAKTSHLGMSAEEREQAGITDGLIRLSVGLEDARDLIADLDQALAKVMDRHPV